MMNGVTNGANPPTLSAQRALYAGSVVFTAGFGIYIYFTIDSVRLLARLPRGDHTRRLLLPYTLALFALNAAFAVSQMIVTEMATIEPSAPENNYSCPPVLVLHSVLAALPIIFNDILFLYRVVQVTRWRRSVLILPALIYLVMFVIGTVSMLKSSSDPCPINQAIPVSLAISIGLTTILNLVFGVVIVRKLSWARQAAMLYPHGGMLASRYARLIYFIVESALLWIVAGILYLVTVFFTTSAGSFFEFFFATSMMLSPALLTYHIARERRTECTSTSTAVPLVAVQTKHIVAAEQSSV